MLRTFRKSAAKIGGASSDWFASIGVRFAYTPELRATEKLFENPPETIAESSREMWAAIHLMFENISKLS